MAIRNTQRLAHSASRVTRSKGHLPKNFSTISANVHGSYGGQFSDDGKKKPQSPRDGETNGGNKNREDELVSFTGTWIGEGKGKGGSK